jgi:hypothetical protein
MAASIRTVKWIVRISIAFSSQRILAAQRAGVRLVPQCSIFENLDREGLGHSHRRNAAALERNSIRA